MSSSLQKSGNYTGFKARGSETSDFCLLCANAICVHDKIKDKIRFWNELVHFRTKLSLRYVWIFQVRIEHFVYHGSCHQIQVYSARAGHWIRQGEKPKDSLHRFVTSRVCGSNMLIMQHFLEGFFCHPVQITDSRHLI